MTRNFHLENRPNITSFTRLFLQHLQCVSPLNSTQVNHCYKPGKDQTCSAHRISPPPPNKKKHHYAMLISNPANSVQLSDNSPLPNIYRLLPCSSASNSCTYPLSRTLNKIYPPPPKKKNTDQHRKTLPMSYFIRLTCLNPTRLI